MTGIGFQKIITIRQLLTDINMTEYHTCLLYTSIHAPSVEESTPHPHLSDNQVFYLLCLLRYDKDGTIPVSYTHLDVYKRQASVYRTSFFNVIYFSIKLII